MISSIRIRTASLFGRDRYSWFRGPLAILLALLLLGPFPVSRDWSLVPRASALDLCAGNNRIMQACGIPASFETSATEGFLRAHNIPASELPLIQQYGRADLRNELRSNLFTNVRAIIRKSPSNRTDEEKAIYAWIQNAVWEHEKEQLAVAIRDRDDWKARPCTWRPDPDIAQLYNLNYDGSLWCSACNSLSGLFTVAPPVPSKSYFLTAALQRTFGQKLASTPDGAAVLSGMLQTDWSSVGVAAAGGLSVLGGVGVALTIVHFVASAGATGSGLASATTGALLLTSPGGPAGIILTGVIIGAIATFQVYEQQKTLAQLDTLTTDYNWKVNHKPDLATYLECAPCVHKMRMAFAENTLPDYPSTALPPGRRSGDRNFVITPMGGSPVVSPTFTHQDWIDTKWTVQPSGGWISAQGVKKNGATDYQFGVSFKFKGWDGSPYIANRKDLHFEVSKLAPQLGDTPKCEPDVSGVTPGDVSKCAMYTATSLNLLDANGDKVTVRFTNFPLFTSPETLVADLTTTSTLEVVATGDPLPTISLTSSLPAGFSFSAVPGIGKITINGATPGTYDLTFRADNGASPATQAVKVIASTPVQILGPENYSVYGNQPFSQLFTVAGSPKPTLTCTGNAFFQSTGAVFTDHGNGTATLSGTIGPVTRTADNAPASPIPVQCTLTATNGVTTDTKNISIFGVIAPEATITSPTTATWVDNDFNELRVTTSVPAGPLGVPKVSFSLPCETPSWLTLKDNGDGTAVLSGRPTFGTTSLPLLLFVSTAELPRCHSGFKIGPNGVEYTPIPPNITLNVRHIPVLPDPLHAFMTAGVPIVTTLYAGSPAGGDGSVSGTPPPGVQFTGGPFSTWRLSGTPEVGSGGQYDMDYTATSPAGSASGIFRLFVLEAPKIVSLETAIFRTGQSNSFVVDTTGFPKSAIPGLRDPMRITVQGMLPPGVVFSDTNPAGLHIGSAVFSGNPQSSARGTYPLTLTASNGADSVAQNFTLVVALPGDATNDGVVNCSDMDAVGASFGYYRGNARYNPNADLNGDGVVDFADVASVESHLPAGTTCVFSKGFSVMSASVTTRGKSGIIDLTASFILNPVSNGIDPVTQPFSLQVGDYNVTLPAGSFKIQPNGAHKGSWVYDGKVNGAQLSVRIQPSGSNAFQVIATTGPGQLSPANPMPVRIRIGDDSGTVTVNVGSQ